MLRMYVPVLACAVLVVGGCGGDNDDDGSSGSGAQSPPAQTRLTKAEYVTQANKICSDTEDAQEEFDDKLDDLDRNDLPAAAPIIEDGLETTREGYDKLKALSPPAADQAEVDAYLAALDRLLDAYDGLAKAARDDDRAAGQRVAAEVQKLDDAQEPLGEALGLDDCEKIF